MNLSVSIEGQIKERMKSPLALLSGHACRLKLLGPDCAEIICQGKKISVLLDGDNCLCFRLVPVGDAHISGEQALHYAQRHCRRPFPFKYAFRNDGLQLLSEFWTVESTRPDIMLKHVSAWIRHCTKGATGAHKFIEETLPGKTVADIQALLEGLPYGFRPADSGWVGSFDTQFNFYRIKAAASTAQGLATIRFEICGDLLSGDNTRVSDALALFLLEANAQTRFVRFGLTSPREGHLLPAIETVLPLELLTERSARAHLAALVVGAARVRAEINALANPDLAEAYLRFSVPAVRLRGEAGHHE